MRKPAPQVGLFPMTAKNAIARTVHHVIATLVVKAAFAHIGDNMPIIGYDIHIFLCTCDKCGKQEEVTQNNDHGIYNGAQAARSLGWSFGQNGYILCDVCRKNNKFDRHKTK